MNKIKNFITKVKEQVSTKLILIFIIAIVAMTFVCLGSSISYQHLIESIFEEMSDGGIATYEVYIEGLEDTLVNVGDTLVGEDMIVNAIAEKNVETIKTEYAKVAHTSNVMDTVTFLDSQGKVIYSTSEASANGTDLSKAVHVENSMKGSVVSSYITNFEGADIAYATGYPVKQNGRVVGVISFMIDLTDSTILDDLKTKTGYQYTIFNDDTRIATTLYDESNQRMVGTKPDAKVLKTVKEEKKDFKAVIEIAGNLYATKYVPISDDNGKYVGMAFSGVSVAESEKSVMAVRYVCLAIAILICIISIVGSVIACKKIITNPLSEFTIVIQALEKWDIENNTALMKIDTKSKDEIGVMANGISLMANGLVDFCHEIISVLNSLADGDLTVKYNRDLFIGDLRQVDEALNKIILSLNTSMSKIRVSADEVASGAEEVSSGAQSLSQGATEQASEIEQLSNLVKDITDKISLNARHATEANELTGNTHTISVESKGNMDSLKSAMLEINEVTAKMERIVKTIDDFAFQTNILALNAAVEAARAGEHGRGFSVVADEVRSLAGKSAEAAKATGDLIENAVQIVESGVMLAQETSESFEKVVDLMNDVIEKVENIADASNEQAMAASNIVTSIDEITRVIQTNSATAEESAAASEELSSLSHVFKDVVNQFKVDEELNEMGFRSSAADYVNEVAYNEPVRQEPVRRAEPVRTEKTEKSSTQIDTDVEVFTDDSDDKYF